MSSGDSEEKMADSLKHVLIQDGEDDLEETPTIIRDEEFPEMGMTLDGKRRSLMPSDVGMICLNRFLEALKACWTKVIESNPMNWVYLALVGVCMAFTGYAVESMVLFLQRSRAQIADTGSYVGDWALWVLFSLLFLLLSAAITHIVQENAAGSGIPEMKSILGGVVVSKYLTLRTLVTKFFGLIFSLGSGIPIGKEGPFVHMSAIIATQLASLTPFRYIIHNPYLIRQMQSVAVAVGVAACFGAPVGGVLFSIEVTCTVFNVSNLWKCFYGSAWTILVYRTLHEIASLGKYEFTDLDQEEFGPVLFLFIIIGIICGLVAAGFLSMFTEWQKLITKYNLQRPKRRYGFVSIVVVSLGLLAYPFYSLRITNRDVSNEMFSRGELNENHWTWGTKYFTMLAYVVLKLVFTSIAICLPVPCGCLTPVFASGAVLGRLFGEVLHAANSNFVPGVYAIVGAAALSSAVTRSLSVVIIVFEVTGELHNLLGVLIASLFAYAVSGAFHPHSIYDLILATRGLSHLPTLKKRAKTAAHLMQIEMAYIHVKSTYEELQNALLNFSYTDYPLVESEEDPKLIGTIPRHVLYRCVLRHVEVYVQANGFASLPEKARERFVSFQREGAPPAVDTTKAHMMAWWDTISINNNHQASRFDALERVASPQMDNSDRESHLVRGTNTTRLMQVLRNRGFDVEDKKGNESREAGIVYKAPRQTDKDSSKFAKTKKDASRVLEEKPIEGKEHRQRSRSSKSDSYSHDPLDIPLSSVRRESKDSSQASLPIDEKLSDEEKREVKFMGWMNKHVTFTRFETMALDNGPFMVIEETPAQRVAFVMSILGLTQVFVVNRGVLLGVITKEDLFEHTNS
ncbi:hypothetical protein AAMO2058_000459400 [Amorphochlora amoebiformis]